MQIVAIRWRPWPISRPISNTFLKKVNSRFIDKNEKGANLKDLAFGRHCAHLDLGRAVFGPDFDLPAGGKNQ
jgi:hypothetical protein